MSVVPSEVVAKIQFYEDHNTPWSSNAVAIGTTTTEVTALQTKTAAARTAYDEQQAAQLAAKDATLRLRLAVEAMATAGGSIIKKVRAKAQTDGLGVYALASLPAPATPTPVPPPGTPTDFTAALDGNGALSLKWKCVNPPGSSGTIYQVWRRSTPTGEFTYLGGSGSKDFDDATIPAGSSSVTYQIQAVRSTAVGAWAQFNVNFGVAAGGGAGAPMTVSVVETRPTRVAA